MASAKPAGGVAADDAGDVGAVAAARAVGAGRGARVAAGRDAREAEAADDVAAEVGMVVVHAGVHHCPDDAGAVDAEAGEVALVAGDGRAAGWLPATIWSDISSSRIGRGLSNPSHRTLSSAATASSALASRRRMAS